MFEQDSKNMMRIIKDITIRTPAEACLKQVKCDHVDIHKLQDTYGGKSERETKKTEAS